MTEPVASPSSFKHKALEELRAFWVITLYLAVFLGCFNLYRRLVLADAGVAYLSYGIRLIEALIIAKVILIGQWLGLGKRYEERELALAVLFKSLLFGLFIGAFSILEELIKGLIHHAGWSEILASISARSSFEMLARVLLMVVALIPFFAFVELGRVLGPGKLATLFFSRREAAP
jgi:hypothetical protein